ncbi:MAG: response regulator transcription factor [Burkholderiaceae bacterium]
MPISIVIVEDDFRFAFEMLKVLGSVDGFIISGYAATVAQGLDLLRSASPDILVVDLQLPDGDGRELIALARKAEPNMAILVFTVFGEEDRVIGAIEAGASGYLLKGVKDHELVVALQQAAAGESPISPAIARHLLTRVRPTPPADDQSALVGPPAVSAQHPSDRLTPREIEVLRMVAQGFIAEEIGARMTVSVHTVRAHIRNIYAKLHVGRRVQAISEAHRRGYL